MTTIALVGALLMNDMPSKYGVDRVNLVEKEKKESPTLPGEEIYDVQMPATKLVALLPALCALLMTFLCIVVSVMTST